MRKLLWVGDAACESGFARCTHKTLETLCKSWQVLVLGLNYLGDPHGYPYPIFPARTGGDFLGVNRLTAMIEGGKPDVIVIQNDPLHFHSYLEEMKPFLGKIPVVGAVAVDGLNCRGDVLNPLSDAIFWTQFGLDEARRGGYIGRASVIPLGVDLDIYKPIEKAEARKIAGLDMLDPDAFIVGFVGRNQPRKRIDLLIAAFAEWVKTSATKNAYLYCHVSPTGDVGWSLKQLIHYHLPEVIYGKRYISMEPDVWHGITEADMAITYNCFDVMATCSCEGFWLPGLEAMACGVPVIGPDWSALGDWPGDAMLKVPCPTSLATPGGSNAIHGVPDKEQLIWAMNELYSSNESLQTLRAAGLRKAAESRYRWAHIGKAFGQVLDSVYCVA